MNYFHSVFSWLSSAVESCYKHTMKITSAISFIVLLFSTSLTVAAPQNHVLKLSSGAQISVTSSLYDTEKPTLILLPGIYRGYLENEKLLQILTQRKINWVSLHFSRHPQSLLSGSHLFSGMVNSQELTHEVLQIKKSLRIRKPVLVSLSFSASLSPYWNKRDFPVLIETAPMGRSNETQAPNAAYESWQQWMNLFPVWGSFVTQTSEYWSYRAYWLQQVDELITSYPHYAQKRVAIAEGLAQLAWSAKGFDLRNQDFKKGPERFWILGEKENANRLRIQLEAIQLHKQTGPKGRRVYTVKNAGHTVPFEQPETYAKALVSILNQLRY